MKIFAGIHDLNGASAVCLAFCALLLSSCSSGLPGFRPVNFSNDGETRVFISNNVCMHAPDDQKQEMAPIVAALATQAVGLLLDKAATVLKDGSAGGSLPESTSSVNFEPLPGTIPRCILIVRGIFWDGAVDDGYEEIVDQLQEPLTEVDSNIISSAPYVEEVRKEKLGKPSFRTPQSFASESEKEFWSQMVNVHNKELERDLVDFRYQKFMIPDGAARAKSVDHVLEIQVLSSANKRFLTLAPVYARINRSVDNDRRGTRSLVVTAEFLTNRYISDRLGGSSQEKTGGIIILDNLKLGEVKKFGSMSSEKARFPHETNWFPVFNGIVVNVDGKAGDGNDEDDLVVDSHPAILQSVSEEAASVTLTVKVVEARPNKDGRAFVAEVLAGVKDTVKQTASAKLVSTAQVKAAENAAYVKALTAISQKEDAQNLAVEKYSSYCDAAASSFGSVPDAELLAKIKAANHASNELSKLLGPNALPIYGGKLESSTRSDNPINLGICRRVAVDQQ